MPGPTSIALDPGGATPAPPGPRLPLFDLGRSWPGIRAEVVEVFEHLAAAGEFTLGRDLQLFEGEFADYCGSDECVGTSSGTSAIEVALRGLGAGPGTEVVTVAHTFVATVEAVAATGATPVLVDIDPATRCMDPARLSAALTDRTAAVVVVHLYGRPAPMDAILELCAKRGVPVVEDCAQAHGARLYGRRVGSLGSAGAFSFYPTKNLGAFGDGGAIVTDDMALAAAARSLRHHGAHPDDANLHLRADGGTERLDNLQAAILRIKLRRLDADNEQRRRAAGRYRELLGGLPVQLPPEDPPGGEQVYHLFVVEVDERDLVRTRLAQAGIAAAVHYPTPVHLQPAWRSIGLGAGDLPVSERLASRCLSLPIFPGIENSEIERVAAALEGALA